MGLVHFLASHWRLDYWHLNHDFDLVGHPAIRLLYVNCENMYFWYVRTIVTTL